MADGWFLMRAPNMPVEAPMELAAQVAQSREPCRGVVETA